MIFKKKKKLKLKAETVCNIYNEFIYVTTINAICSWCRAGGNLRTKSDRESFEEWLSNLDIFHKEPKKTTNYIVSDIMGVIDSHGCSNWADNAKDYLSKK